MYNITHLDKIVLVHNIDVADDFKSVFHLHYSLFQSLKSKNNEMEYYAQKLFDTRAKTEN